MNKIYACSDLHGNYNLYEQINNYIDETDVVYFLGDAGDRGPDGFKCIEAIYENPQWKYLKGNHEDMMAKAAHDREEFDLWMYNGGETTLNQMREMIPAKADRKIWYNRLYQLPTQFTITNIYNQTIYMTHSGLINATWGDDTVWDRTHFLYNNEELEENEFIVHGHTPTEVLRDRIAIFDIDDNALDPSDVCIYDEGHKIDIDCGTAWTNKTALIDLDTFEVHYFKEIQND